jgi:hypothetical protein
VGFVGSLLREPAEAGSLKRSRVVAKVEARVEGTAGKRLKEAL